MPMTTRSMTAAEEETEKCFWEVIEKLKKEPYYNGNIFESANMAEKLQKDDDYYNRYISHGLSCGWINEEDDEDDDDTTGEDLFVPLCQSFGGRETDEEDDGNFVEPSEFEEFTYYGTTFWKNVDEASSKRGQWFYEYNNGEIGDELGIYTSDTELEFADWEGKDREDYVPALYWGRIVGRQCGICWDRPHPVAKLIKQIQNYVRKMQNYVRGQKPCGELYLR